MLLQANLVAAFEQSLVNMTSRLRHLAETAEEKVGDSGKEVAAWERDSSGQPGWGQPSYLEWQHLLATWCHCSTQWGNSYHFCHRTRSCWICGKPSIFSRRRTQKPRLLFREPSMPRRPRPKVGHCAAGAGRAATRQAGYLLQVFIRAHDMLDAIANSKESKSDVLGAGVTIQRMGASARGSLTPLGRWALALPCRPKPLQSLHQAQSLVLLCIHAHVGSIKRGHY